MKLRVLVLISVCIGMEAQNASLNDAWAAAAKGDRARAITITREIAKREPRNADARLLLGSLLVEEGQRTEAIEQLYEAVHLRPKSAEALNALGEAYNSFGDAKAARAAFEKSVALDPKFGVAQANLGSVLLQMGDSASAADHLDRAIKLMGRSAEAADAHYARAKIFTAAGQIDQAAAHLEQAVALRADFAEAWSDLGQARKAKLDDGGAVTAFERAVELNRGDPIAQYRLGSEYLHANQLPQAIEHLQAAYKLAPQDQSTLNALQTALRQAGRTEEAAAIKQKLAEVLRKRDGDSQAGLKALRLNNEGTELERGGNLQEAAARYREALELQPDHNGIRVNLAVALLRIGRWTEGLNEMHEALGRDPNNHDIQLALKDALSQAPPALLPDWAKTARPAENRP